MSSTAPVLSPPTEDSENIAHQQIQQTSPFDKPVKPVEQQKASVSFTKDEESEVSVSTSPVEPVREVSRKTVLPTFTEAQMSEHRPRRTRAKPVATKSPRKRRGTRVQTAPVFELINVATPQSKQLAQAKRMVRNALNKKKESVRKAVMSEAPEEIEQRYQELASEWEQERNQNAESLRLQSRSLCEMCPALSHKMKISEKELAERKEELAEAEQRIKDLQQELEAVEATGIELENALSQAEFSESVAEKTKVELEQARAEVESLRVGVAEAKNEQQRAQEAEAAALAATELLQAKVAEVEKERDAAVRSAEESASVVPEACTTCIDLENELKGVNAQLVDRFAEVAGLEKNLQDAKVQLEEEKNKVCDSCTSLEQAHLESVERRNELARQLEAQEALVVDLKNNVEALEKSLEEEIRRECESCKSLELALEDALQQNEEATRENENHQLQISALTSQVEELEGFKDQTAQLEELEALCEENSATISEMEQNLQQYAASDKQNQETIAHLEASEERLTGEKNAIAGEFEAYQEQVAPKLSQLDEQTDLIRQLREKISQLEGFEKEALRKMQRFEEEKMEHYILRRDLHNEVQTLKGAIRVFCRVRPPSGTESKGNVTYKFLSTDDSKTSNGYVDARNELEIVHPPRASVDGSKKKMASKRFQYDRVFSTQVCLSLFLFFSSSSSFFICHVWAVLLYYLTLITSSCTCSSFITCCS